jgi:Serine/Threonine/Tyrosine Kinase found in polyvalent proteins
MLQDGERQKVAHIVHGTLLEGQQDTATTIRNLLCASYTTSRTVKKDFESKLLIKEKQTAFLIDYCKNNNLLLDSPVKEQFIARGGEAMVYLALDKRSVIKLNDAVYYATWLEFFNSVLLHNIFFPFTSYQFLGFTLVDNKLMAVLKQNFIISNELVDLADIKEFLEFNGFKNTKNQDYKNADLGLILEDMHDENVLRNADTLFFIDSVFYAVPPEI